VASELTQDGMVITSALAQPSRGLARALARRRTLSVVALSTFLALLATGLTLPTIDAEAVASETLRPDMTPHEREQAIATATRLHEVASWASAALGPAATAVLLALALWLGFLVAGARAGFKSTFTVAAHALVPQALKALLTVPAALAHAPVLPEQVSRLLPSNLGAVLPAASAWPGPALAAASAVDLFSLWTVLLISAGMRQASGASTVRTWAVVLTLFFAYVALFKVVPSAAPLGGP
jgi:hypothetical protein